MSFQEKSVAAMTVALVVVYGAYFAVVARWLATTPADQIVHQPLMIAAVLPLVVLAVAEADAFWIAHTLLVGWVLAELTAGAVRILLYRRGG